MGVLSFWDWSGVSVIPPFLRSWREFSVSTFPGALNRVADCEELCCCCAVVCLLRKLRLLSFAQHSVKPGGLIRLSNMWAARPQKEQVGNVSLRLSACVCVCSVLFASRGFGRYVSATLLGFGLSLGSQRGHVKRTVTGGLLNQLD